MDALQKMAMFQERRKAEDNDDDDRMFECDAALDEGLDEAGRHDWRVDYLRWATYGEDPSFL